MNLGPHVQRKEQKGVPRKGKVKSDGSEGYDVHFQQSN